MSSFPKDTPSNNTLSLIQNGVNLRGTCPRCGLTAQELHDSGRMGCAACYDAFVDMVEFAAIGLHGVGELQRSPSPVPLPADRNASPWPTRKAVPIRNSRS